MKALLSFVLALCVLAVAAPAALSSPTPNRIVRSNRPATCWSGYSYDGVQSPTRAFGVAGTLKMARTSSVVTGHVAAWIGVGGAGMGPGGADEWLQAGIVREAGTADVLYYEYKRPGDTDATYVTLGTATADTAYSFSVYEEAGQANTWRVALNGTPVSAPVVLPGSHGLFRPIATAENWDGGVAGSCNGYDFSFADLTVRAQFGGTWQPFALSRVLRDPAYRLAMRASGFTASS